MGLGGIAAEAAVLLSERGLGGRDPDLATRYHYWLREKGGRAEAARALARRWAALLPGKSREVSGDGLATCIALAFPDRLSKRRDESGEHWLSVGGRGFRLDPALPLARAEWLAVADIQGAASGARILSAVAIEAVEVERLFGPEIEDASHVRFDPASGGVRTMRGRRLGAIMLSEAGNAAASPEEIAAALLEGIRMHGLGLLPWNDAARQLRERAHWAGIDGLDEAALIATRDHWLAPLLAGKRKLAEIGGAALRDALWALLGWEGQQALARTAPSHFTSPAGTSHEIDYAAEAGPTVTLRVQALFGLAEHPVIGRDRTPLILSLTSPAGRPIQTTRDLPGFWRGSWADVAREMRGRYPRHNWPDDPASALASLKTKKALDRGK